MNHQPIGQAKREKGKAKKNGGQAHATRIPQEKSHHVQKPGHKGANTRTSA
jgi:hypothetical protein